MRKWNCLCLSGVGLFYVDILGVLLVLCRVLVIYVFLHLRYLGAKLRFYKFIEVNQTIFICVSFVDNLVDCLV